MDIPSYLRTATASTSASSKRVALLVVICGVLSASPTCAKLTAALESTSEASCVSAESCEEWGEGFEVPVLLLQSAHRLNSSEGGELETVRGRTTGGANDSFSIVAQPVPFGIVGSGSVSERPFLQVWSKNVADKVSEGLRWTYNVDGERDKKQKLQNGYKSESTKQDIFQKATLSEWAVLISVVAALLAFDWFFLQSFEDTTLMHITVLLFWICCGLGYSLYFLLRYGLDDGSNWFAGYLLDWLLSMDNIFLFSIVFSNMRTPKEQRRKALFIGVSGAIAFRVVFFIILFHLMHLNGCIHIVLGLMLVVCGAWQMAEIRAEEELEEEFELMNLNTVKFLGWLLGSRLQPKYDVASSAAFTRDDSGRLCATMLFIAISYLLVVDFLFAMDGCSAKIAVIDNQYIAYSSSIFALSSLRAMFFVFEDLAERFTFLRCGICLILIFIGVQMILSAGFNHMPGTSIFVVAGTIIVGSIAYSRGSEKRVDLLPKSGDPSPRSVSSSAK